jgi:hypothetical protein
LAIATNALPFGMRDIKVTPITANVAGAITYGTFVDLPAAQTLSWNTTEDYEQVRGDDIVQGEHGNGRLIEWELAAGGISVDAAAVMLGGTVSSTGVTPNVVKTLAWLGTTAAPYFRIDGQAINDNGGDFKVVIYRAKATGGMEGEFADGSFFTSGISGNGYANADNELFDLVHSETAANITQPA